MPQSIHVNGIELFFRDIGSGEPLLLLHGFTGSGDDWQHVFAEPLAGYRLIAPDLRGHGRSTNPSGQFTFADAARDIFALLDQLGIGRVSAIGMSAGANTLLNRYNQRNIGSNRTQQIGIERLDRMHMHKPAAYV